MKTELEIAKENLKLELLHECMETRLPCEEHKQSCQRFLEFLEEDNYKQMRDGKKIEDLQNTIKLYEENGI